jgi:hypothetical protein
MSAHRGQQLQHDKGNDTSTMAQTRKLEGGNNANAMTVTTPMQHEDKVVSAIWMTMPVQQGLQRPCNVGNGTSARGQQGHPDNGKDTCWGWIIIN